MGSTKKPKQIVKPIAEELGEEIKKIPKEMLGQVVGKKSEQPSPIVEAMNQGSGEMSAQEKLHREAETKRNMAKLEEEMQKARVERAQREKEWYEKQEHIFSDPGKPMNELPIMPTSKPSRGNPNAMGGKGKSKSMETRKSKH